MIPIIKIKPNKEQLEESYNRLKSLRKVGLEFGYTGEGIRNLLDQNNISKQISSANKYTCDDDFFSRDNELSFYIAGFIAADGCVKARKNKNEASVVAISLAEKDKNHLLNIKNIMSVEHPLSQKTVRNSFRNKEWKDSFQFELQFTSRNMCKDLERFNIVQRKTHIYTFPNWLINHPLVNHFMRGYNDGDGSFYINDGVNVKQVFFSLRGTSEFLHTFRNILEQNCNVNKRQNDIRINCGIGVLEYGGNKVISSIANFLYGNNTTLFLNRKYEVCRNSIYFNGVI